MNLQSHHQSASLISIILCACRSCTRSQLQTHTHHQGTPDRKASDNPHHKRPSVMWCPTLFFTLLLLTAAGLISGAALPPSLPIQNPQTPGLSLNCHRIPSQPATRRLPNIRDPTTSVTVPGSLSPRVLPYCIEGVLTGGQHSSDFTLSPQHVWKLYWVDERLVLGGE